MVRRLPLALVLLSSLTLACDTGSGAEGGEETGDSGGGTSGVPSNAYCDPVSDWPADYESLEAEVLAVTNQMRAAGADCGSQGTFPPAPPLSGNSALNCAARVHSKDMVDRDFFDHTNPDGELPWDRVESAGYTYSSAGENIAAGNATAAATVQQWMESDGHCANIMSADFDELAVGYYPGGQWGHMWTQVFGRQ